MNNPVNYDKVADEYDQRYHKNPHQGILSALRRLLRQENLLKVLEVGCGTIHWLKALEQLEDINSFGIDSSLKMLKTGKGPAEVVLCQGSAEYLPMKSNAIDFIYCINALHHFNDKLAFIQEAHRLLTTGGKIAIIGMDPRDNRNQWYIFRFFQGTFQKDLERYPSWDQIQDWLNQAGFANITSMDVELIHDPKSGSDVLSDPFLNKNACSQLSLLSQEEYKQGLEKIKEKITNNPDAPLIFENDIIFSMITGEKQQ